MADRDGSHSGRALRRTTALLVLVVLLAAAAAHRLDLGERLGVAAPDPATEPAAVPPPAGLRLPAAGEPAAVAGKAPARTADATAVADAVRRLGRSPQLGGRALVAVSELDTGRMLVRSGPRAVVPASTLKLLTSAAVLHELGPEHRFRTTVVRRGRTVVLVGGGDPLLGRDRQPDADYPARADLASLARDTARALRRAGITRVRLGYDPSLFAGPSVNRYWEDGYIPGDVVSPITSLWVDEGRERTGDAARSGDPAAAAAQVFADALAARSIRITGSPTERSAPAGGAEIAAVESAPLAQVVDHTLRLSDNEAAEVLARWVAISRGRPASFTGGAWAVRDALTELGVSLQGAVIHDGSGLARSNRLRFGTILDVLEVAAADSRLRAVLTGLPVAGFTGSLASRFDSAPTIARGDVRAKTGTLTGVSGLAGTVVTRDGVRLAFVVAADRIPPEDTLEARARLDRLAGALAACICAA